MYHIFVYYSGPKKRSNTFFLNHQIIRYSCSFLMNRESKPRQEHQREISKKLFRNSATGVYVRIPKN